jgi:hypothetical protein
VDKKIDFSQFRIDDHSEFDTLRQRAAERRRRAAGGSANCPQKRTPVSSKADTGVLKSGTRLVNCYVNSAVGGFNNNDEATTRRYIPPIWEDMVVKFDSLSAISIRVFLHLWQKRAMKGEQPVTLTNEGLKKFKIDRRRKRQALLQLEAAGLIRVEWRRNRNPLVTLLETA